MSLRNKRVLITAGPTWVAIDSIRVISNIATGTTGILLAKRFNALGAKVTLILGPVGDVYLDEKIKILRFRYFEELRKAVKKELTSKHYNIIIHSAAVSDFRPQRLIKGKLKSEKAHTLTLTPLPKIVKEIRRLAPSAKLVIFKLESGVSDKELIRKAKTALIDCNADIAVANKIKPKYRAYILNATDRIYAPLNSKGELMRGLVKAIVKG